MAAHNVRPTIDVAAGRAVFEHDLPRALTFRGASAPEHLSWKIVGARSLLIPFRARIAAVSEEYLLRIDFLTGREWPPSARFVNPETLDYVVGQDAHHLPILQSPEIHVHPAYQPASGGQPIQLICCSAVYQYYDVLHGGDDAVLWRETDDFLVTLAAIGRAMSSHHCGRHPANA